MAYKVYFDDLLFPVAPSKLEMKINGKNKSMTLITEGEINILKQVGLTDINFEVLLPQVKYPFAIYENGFQGAEVYLKKLKELKVGRLPFNFWIERSFPNGEGIFGTTMRVSLEDYKIKEDSKNGYDLMVDITLKEFKEYSRKDCTVTIVNGETRVSIQSVRETGNSPAPKETPKSYTVVRGDTLWAIAKKFYGNGSKYSKIVSGNKDKVKNPNDIRVGQVLTIPV